MRREAGPKRTAAQKTRPKMRRPRSFATPALPMRMSRARPGCSYLTLRVVSSINFEILRRGFGHRTAAGTYCLASHSHNITVHAMGQYSRSEVSAQSTIRSTGRCPAVQNWTGFPPGPELVSDRAARILSTAPRSMPARYPQGAVWPHLVVALPPAFELVTYVGKSEQHLDVQTFIAQASVCTPN